MKRILNTNVFTGGAGTSRRPRTRVRTRFSFKKILLFHRSQQKYIIKHYCSKNWSCDNLRCTNTKHWYCTMHLESVYCAIPRIGYFTFWFRSRLRLVWSWPRTWPKKYIFHRRKITHYLATIFESINQLISHNAWTQTVFAGHNPIFFIIL